MTVIQRSRIPRKAGMTWRPSLAGLSYIPVLIYAAIIVVPLYYLIISAFKDNLTIFGAPLAFPNSLSLDNFRRADSAARLSSGMINSAVITLGAQALNLLLAIPAAYGIARIPTRASDLVERLFALGFLIPTFAVLVPTFLLAIRLDLYQTRLFLVLFYPATVLPLSVTLLAQFMRIIPIELEESARLDGAGRMRILWHILLPLSLPGIATIVLLNFLSFWNEYIFALIILGSEYRTVQVALPTLRSQFITEFGLLAAGTVFTLIPVYVMYIILQRRMQDALVAGAVKG